MPVPVVGIELSSGKTTQFGKGWHSKVPILSSPPSLSSYITCLHFIRPLLSLCFFCGLVIIMLFAGESSTSRL
uniref:Uncharacterized protein n=1 Tax=Arundo donax TaxID=35708 RepID=A0A0A9FGM5_ARUDO